MRTIIIDLAHICTVKALHIYLAYKLDLPAYYGKNLDALHDVLTETGEDTRLVLRTQGACGEVKACLPGLMRVMEDAAEENPHLTIDRE